MVITVVELFHTSCSLLVVGSWQYLGFLLHIYLIHLVLSGRSKYHVFFLILVCIPWNSHSVQPIHLPKRCLSLQCSYFLLFRTVEDFRDWTNWLFYRGGIGVKGEESWEAWWDEELVR